MQPTDGVLRLTADPYEVSNLAQSTSPDRIQQQRTLGQQLSQLATCGGSCQALEFNP
jgi:hypothetical protein